MSGLNVTVYKGSKEGKIVKSELHRDTLNLKPDEVLLKITHAGLCGTDQHYKTSDMVLGHEGVGIVQQVGADVDNFTLGDRAGWGFLHDACLHCDQCLSGNEIYCDKRAMYGGADTDQGAFASHAVWKAAFLFHIPEAISSEEAAPLMCAGATVFNALHLINVRATDRVGVVGIGGLGHLAIQFASKMGCEVVVFSGTDSKREEAKQLGASEFYATKGLKKIDIGRPVDHLLVTTSAQPDWNLFMPVVASMGTIVPLSVSEGELAMPYMTIVIKGIRVQGCICPSRGVHVKMLRFAAFHGIKPITQKFQMGVEGIEDAMKRLDSGQVRYRAVLVA
ncbi:chaperonin 10-like protein [Melanogaster broomeanus]|nr:chaperonin 10-like protein [Melanogaster broomeanus]